MTRREASRAEAARKNAARKNAARRKRTPLPASIKANHLLPTFSHFLAVRDIELSTLDVRAAFAAMIAYHAEIAVDGRSHDAGTDTLLFQAGPMRRHKTRAAHAVVNVTRQLYGGAGNSQQLGLTLRYPKATFDGAFSIWSHLTERGVAGALAKALAELEARGVLAASATGVDVDVARF